MSAQDLERRAMELLKAEYERSKLRVMICAETGAALRAIVAALRQQPAPVDLEQFREAVSADDVAVLRRLKDALPTVGLNGWHKGVSALDRLLSIIDNAGKVEPPLADETGPYPFGAGIEPNPKARYWQQRSAFWMAEALRLGYAPPGETPTHQPAPVVDAGNWIAADDRELNAGRLKALHRGLELARKWSAGTGTHGHTDRMVRDMADELRSALSSQDGDYNQQPAPVVDDAMVSRATAAYNGIWESTTHREAMRAALTAALARAQGVQS